jgi:hypothetical protein
MSSGNMPGEAGDSERSVAVVPGSAALVTRQIRDDIELVATLIRDANKQDKGAARSQAILTHCALVGAIGVARAVSDPQLSHEILTTVVARLKEQN